MKEILEIGIAIITTTITSYFTTLVLIDLAFSNIRISPVVYVFMIITISEPIIAVLSTTIVRILHVLPLVMVSVLLDDHVVVVQSSTPAVGASITVIRLITIASD